MTNLPRTAFPPFITLKRSKRALLGDRHGIYMRKVIGIGETVLDIIFKKGQPVSAVPGGSTFNAIISLARAGVDTTFISEAGNDRVGEKIISFLRENGADASNVSVFPDSKSPISLAFLDDNNDADYIFYKDHPHDQLEFAYPEINPDDIVLFGSFFALNPVIRPQVAAFLDYAKSHGAILYYDVNFRPAHKNEIMKITPNFIDNLDYADIVRGSYEDFLTLYKKDNSDKVYNAEISFYCRNFIYTHGAEPVEVYGNGGFSKHYDVPAQETVLHRRRGRQLQCRLRLRTYKEQHKPQPTARWSHGTAMGRHGALCSCLLCRLLQGHIQLCQQGFR